MNGLSAWLAELQMQSEWEDQVKGTPIALVASDLHIEDADAFSPS